MDNHLTICFWKFETINTKLKNENFLKAKISTLNKLKKKSFLCSSVPPPTVVIYSHHPIRSSNRPKKRAFYNYSLWLYICNSPLFHILFPSPSSFFFTFPAPNPSLSLSLSQQKNIVQFAYPRNSVNPSSLTEKRHKNKNEKRHLLSSLSPSDHHQQQVRKKKKRKRLNKNLGLGELHF